MELKKNRLAVPIAVFLLSGLIVFGAFIIIAGKYNIIMGGGYRLFVEFSFLDNLQPGAKVKVLGGYNIGHISDIHFENARIIVELFIESKYKINRDAVFTIYSTSLVGQKYVNVDRYTLDTTEFLTNNEHVKGLTPMGFSKVIEVAGSAVQSVLSGAGGGDTMLQVRSAFESTVQLLDGLNTLVQKNQKPLNDSISRMSVSLSSVDLVLSNVERLSRSLADKVDSIESSRIKDIVQNLDILTAQLKTLAVDINRLMGDRNSVLSFTRDKDVKARLDNTVKNLEEFSKKIKDNPAVLLFGK